jgi:flagellar protein FliO/FliZ
MKLLVLVFCLAGPLAFADDAGAAADASVPVAQVTAAPVIPEPEIPKSEPPELVSEDNLGWTLLRTMVVLGMVIALVYVTLNVGLRRLLGIKPVAGSANIVTVLERVPLDQKRALFVVEAAGEVLLVGGGDGGGLSLITKLDAAEVAKLRATPGPVPVQLSPLLQKLLGRKDPKPPSAT